MNDWHGSIGSRWIRPNAGLSPTENQQLIQQETEEKKLEIFLWNQSDFSIRKVIQIAEIVESFSKFDEMNEITKILNQEIKDKRLNEAD